jgi:hypothetical protein
MKSVGAKAHLFYEKKKYILTPMQLNFFRQFDYITPHLINSETFHNYEFYRTSLMKCKSSNKGRHILSLPGFNWSN